MTQHILGLSYGKDSLACLGATGLASVRRTKCDASGV